MKPYYLLLLTLALNVPVPAQSRYAIVITEIMADPSPMVGLPNYEWIELTNASASAIDLRGWRLADASGQSGAMPAYILAADASVIVCAATAAGALSVFGNTLVVASFPSLDNAGELISLQAANGTTIHAVRYSADWYRNALKQEGGWSLEMIDLHNPCMGSANWKASIDPSGGTPGKINSVNASITDNMPPRLQRSYTMDSNTIVLVFDEPLDSLAAASIAAYTIDGGAMILTAIPVKPLFNEVQLRTTTALVPGKVYTIVAEQLTDCKGNQIGAQNTTKAGRPVPPLAKDIVINEILFNPRPNANDYIELYNNSNKIFDAAQLYLANRNSSAMLSSLISLSNGPFNIYPGDYIVLTADAADLALNYLVKEPSFVFTNTSLPSFPDDKGTVVLLDQQGIILEEVAYSEKWHFKLLDNTEGIALERIDPAKNAQDPGNWHSAASTNGYGTPTYKNAHSVFLQDIAATIEIFPNIFSPDNDGLDDLVSIRYKINEPGFVATITLFNSGGIAIRSLVRNATMGTTGYWNWDGLNDKGQQLPVGIYIVFTEMFNLEGKKKQFKSVVVLARR